MSKKSSARQYSEPVRRPRSESKPTVSSLGGRGNKKAQKISSTRPSGRVRSFDFRNTQPKQVQVDPTFLSRVRGFFPIIMVPSLSVVLGAIIFTTIALLATSTSMSAFPSTVAQFWLVVNAGPVVGRGQMIEYLPLLPTLALMWAVSRAVHRIVKDRVSIADLGVLTLCVFGIPLLITLTACAMLFDAAAVYDLSSPPVLLAVLRTVLVHFIAMTWGMGTRLWRALMRRFGFPEEIVDAFVLAVKVLLRLCLAAAIVYAISLGAHYASVGDTLALYPTAPGKIAAIGISILYLPNVLIATMAVLCGSEVVFGQATLSLFGLNLVPLPPLPLLSAIPAAIPDWAVALMVIPFFASIMSIYKNIPNFRQAGFIIIFGAFNFLIFSYLASGQLGVYEFVGPRLWLSTGLVTLWIGVIALIAATIRFVRSRHSVSDIHDEPGTQDEEVEPGVAATDITDREDTEDIAQNVDDDISGGDNDGNDVNDANDDSATSAIDAEDRADTTDTENDLAKEIENTEETAETDNTENTENAEAIAAHEHEQDVEKHAEALPEQTPVEQTPESQK
ncbi:hypothetical protein EML15_06725 [Corynebacterium sp. sy017]|uniref:cell division protein PerM n=1 Tax=unclassified Corynebacterium TaxID=2624378 RepID=UPI0011857513|nr:MULTISPECIES: DUF6350 family protein [unclassified Corynebacterium]MBP3088836.1 hypothetical protein [Corynebacterium sp. sy017]TSD91179.1 hypothetical protein ELY17_06735 [Corynebacterium sp. SY003]